MIVINENIYYLEVYLLHDGLNELFKHTIYAIINLYPDWSTTFVYRELMRCITAMQYFPTMLFEPRENTNTNVYVTVANPNPGRFRIILGQIGIQVCPRRNPNSDLHWF